ncbi:MAG: NAD(P)-dependent oxidoreductase [Ruminococcus sp.]|nr:NAD(P)-dependent oxidoreductase [Ruminococcus sp.]
MIIAITGAGGFLGTELLKQLSENKDVTVYAFTFESERNRSGFIKADNIIDVDNSEAYAFDYSKIDVLINCAFPRNVEGAGFSQGLDFIQKVIEKAAKDKVGSVINISSQSVYDQSRETPADENTEIILGTKYAVGKYCSELFVNSVCRSIRHTNLRMASLIGAGFDQRITNKFVKQIMDGQQLTVLGGEQRFGYLDVRDAASGIIAVALSDGDWDEVYNLGTESSYTLCQVAENAILAGREFGYEASDPIIKEDINNSKQNSSLICSCFYERFSWKPDHELADTMREIIKRCEI